MAKSKDLALASAIKCTGRDLVHASSACKARVSLAAISLPDAPWDF
jgi:hypothetical protein